MKKLKFKKSDPGSAESESENIAEPELENTEESLGEDKKEKPVKIKRKLNINKRAVFISVMILIILLVYFFVRYGRHYDQRPTDKEKTVSGLEMREDIAGKQPITLTTGSYIAGTDIPTGRYMVTVQRGYGGFTAYEVGTNYPEINGLLGYFADPAYVPSIAVTLMKDQKIEIYGERLKEITFTPLATSFLSELTTGMWIVGQDIKPGTYTISSKDGNSGNLTVLEGNMPVAKVDLGNGGTKFKEKEIISIIEGQKIRISNIPTVVFKAQ